MLHAALMCPCAALVWPCPPEDDPSVLYFSVHRYERGTFFPSKDVLAPPYMAEGATDGAAHSAGLGLGAGTSINIGWNTRSSRDRPGDAEYRAAWRDVLLPIATEYAPPLHPFDISRGHVARIPSLPL